MAKKVILWTTPRCFSNAFLNSISQLRNTKRFHELFTGSHYFVPGSKFDPKDEDIPQEELTCDGVKRILSTDYPDVDLVFSKELTYCLPDSMYDEMISGDFKDFIHTFLIRDPERSIYSYYKVLCHEGDDSLLDPSEAATYYPKMHAFYTFVKERKGVLPVVIDAGNLQTHPEETMKCYCKAVGIQFDPNMMSWEPGSFVPRLKVFASKYWHSTVMQSTGFIKINPGEQKPVPINDMPGEIQKYIEDSRFYYEEMKKDCLNPTII